MALSDFFCGMMSYCKLAFRTSVTRPAFAVFRIKGCQKLCSFGAARGKGCWRKGNESSFAISIFLCCHLPDNRLWLAWWALHQLGLPSLLPFSSQQSCEKHRYLLIGCEAHHPLCARLSSSFTSDLNTLRLRPAIEWEKPFWRVRYRLQQDRPIPTQSRWSLSVKSSQY